MADKRRKRKSGGNTYRKGGKIPKYDLGGLLKIATPIITAINPIAGAGVGLAAGLSEKNKGNTIPKIAESKDPFGSMTKKHGGPVHLDDNSQTGTLASQLAKDIVSAHFKYRMGGAYYRHGGQHNIPGGMDDLKQFNAPSHENGGQNIDANMNPTPKNKAIANIEKKETAFAPDGNSPYIYSDFLRNPETGRTYAEDSTKVDRKYKRSDDISKAGKNKELGNLAKKNERDRRAHSLQKSVIQAIGKYLNGGPVQPIDSLEADATVRESTGMDAVNTFNIDPPMNPETIYGTNPRPINLDPLTAGMKPIWASDTKSHTKGVNKLYEKRHGGVPEYIKGGRPKDTYEDGGFPIPNFADIVTKALKDRSINDITQATSPFDHTRVTSDQVTQPLPSTFDQAASSEITPRNTPDVTSDEGTLDVETDKTFNPDLNKIGLALKGVGLLGSAAQLLEPTAKEKERQADFSRGDELTENLGVDMAPLMNEINLGLNRNLDTIRNVSPTASSYVSRATGAIANAARQAALTKLQGKQQADQMRIASAQREDRKAVSQQAEQIRTDMANLQNRAAKRQFVNNFFNQLSQVGSEFNKADVIKKTIANNKEMSELAIKEGMAILGMKYTNFGLSDDFMKRITSGEYTQDELVKFLGAAAQAKG